MVCVWAMFFSLCSIVCYKVVKNVENSCKDLKCYHTPFQSVKSIVNLAVELYRFLNPISMSFYFCYYNRKKQHTDIVTPFTLMLLMFSKIIGINSFPCISFKIKCCWKLRKIIAIHISWMIDYLHKHGLTRSVFIFSNIFVESFIEWKKYILFSRHVKNEL